MGIFTIRMDCIGNLSFYIFDLPQSWMTNRTNLQVCDINFPAPEVLAKNLLQVIVQQRLKHPNLMIHFAVHMRIRNDKAIAKYLSDVK